MNFCPNPNSPEYQEIITALAQDFKSKNITRPDATAEAVAHAVYKANKGHFIDKAPNGNESVLFRDLVSAVGRKDAILIKAKMYLDEFVKQFGNWFGETIEPGRVDANGEPFLVGNSVIAADGQTALTAFEEKERKPERRQLSNHPNPETKQQAWLKKITEDNADVTLQEYDGIEKYRNGKGMFFERLTEYLRPKFAYDPKTSAEIEDYVARQDFGRRGLDISKDKLTEKINGEAKEFTFDEWKEHMKTVFDQRRAYGKIGHLYMEYILGARDKDRILSEIEKLASDHQIDTAEFSYINKHAERIKHLLNIDPSKDKVMTEQILHSELLGIATRADGIILHENGDTSIGDFKFGNLYKNELTTKMMKYAQETAMGRMNKSKINDAKLEVVMRAVMLKLQNKDMKFRDLFVSQIDNRRIAQKDGILLQDYLDMIGAYYKENNEKVYDELGQNGLLDAENYWGVSKEMSESQYESFIKKNHGAFTDNVSGYMKHLFEQINMATHQIDAFRTGKDNTLSDDERTIEINKLERSRETNMKIILETSSGKSAQELFAATNDISILERYFANVFEVKSDLVQSFAQLMLSQKETARKQLAETNSQYDRLAEKVKKEYMQRRGIPAIADKIGLNSLLGAGLKIYKGDGSGIYDFAYVYKQGHMGWGHYLVNSHDKEWNGLSQVQKDYLEYIANSMNTAFKGGVFNKKHTRANNRDISKATALNLKNRLAYDTDGNLPAGFMPRIPKQGSDMVEKNGLRADKLAKAYLKGKMSDFVEADYDADGEFLHMPVKYIGNHDMVKEGDYSMDLESAYKQFMANMTMNEHMDEVYSVGKGLKDWMTKEANRGKGFKQLHKFLDDQLKIHVLDIKEQSQYLPISWTDSKTGERKRVRIDKFVTGIRTANSFAAMWLQPINATYNLGLISTLNHKSSVVGGLAESFMGVDPASVDFDNKSLIYGEGEFLKLKGDILAGTYENNKLYHLLKHFHYMPEAYDYSVRENEKVVARNGVISTSTPMFLHSFVEDFGTISIFGAFLKHMKVNGKSVYDNYVLETKKDVYGNEYKELAWKGGVRGVERVKTQSGDEYKQITELTTKEIIRLKRASQKIHGSYRQDERSAAELYALGKLFLQFKKYIPAQLKNWFSGKYKDSSIGYYKHRQDGQMVDWTDPVTGKTTQIPVMEWYAQTTRGKFGLLISSFGILVPTLKRIPGFERILQKMGVDTSEAAWKNFQQEIKENGHLKQQLVHAWLNVALSILTLVAFHAAFPDDDDQQTMLGRRMKRFQEDMLEGINPVDMLRMLKTPIASVTRMFDLTQSTMAFSSDLITGERQSNDKLHGQTSLQKNLPILSTIYNLEHFSDEWVQHYGTLR